MWFEVAQIIGLFNVLIWVWAIKEAYMYGRYKAIFVLLSVQVVVDVMKKTLQYPRPVGACACDAFGVRGASTTYGMPSGHVATAVAGLLLLTQGNWVVSALGGVAMMWARYMVGCHTPVQGFIGAIVGGVVFILCGSLR